MYIEQVTGYVQMFYPVCPWGPVPTRVTIVEVGLSHTLAVGLLCIVYLSAGPRPGAPATCRGLAYKFAETLACRSFRSPSVAVLLTNTVRNPLGRVWFNVVLSVVYVTRVVSLPTFYRVGLVRVVKTFFFAHIEHNSKLYPDARERLKNI